MFLLITYFFSLFVVNFVTKLLLPLTSILMIIKLLLKIFENRSIDVDRFYMILQKCKESLHGSSRNSTQSLFKCLSVQGSLTPLKV